MPRPKRTKITAAAVPNARRAATNQSKPEQARQVRAQPLALQVDKVRYGSEVSDASQGLVFVSRKRQARAGATSGHGEALMRGALVQGMDTRDEGSEGGRTTGGAEKEGSGSASGVSHKTGDASANIDTSEEQEEVVVKATQEEPEHQQATRASHGGRLERVAVSPPLEQRSERLQRVASSPPSSPPQVARPRSALRVRGTPAMESSMLALANFKRRPRQPSILRMVQQTSDDGPDGLDDDVDDDLDDLINGLDDFDPEDESTPVKLSRSKAQKIQSGQVSEGERVGEQDLRTSSSRKRKFSSVEPEVQVPRSSPPEMGSPGEMVPSSFPPSDSPGLPERPERLEGFHVERNADKAPSLAEWSETMAPPKSSSPTQGDREPNYWEDNHTTTAASAPKRRGRPPRVQSTAAGQTSTSKPGVKPASTKAPTKQVSLSTAALKSLLPQRRQRQRRAVRRDAYDIPSSEGIDTGMLGEHDDELHLPATRTAKKTRGRRRKANADAGTESTPAVSAGGKRLNQQRQDPEIVLSSPVSTRDRRKISKDKDKDKDTDTDRNQKKTYGKRRQAASDKENESSYADEGDGQAEDDYGQGHEQEGKSTLADVVTAKELVAAAQKFRDVDAWEMEFESVEAGGRSSSPWR